MKHTHGEFIGERTIAGRRVLIQCVTWNDDRRCDFAVHDADTHQRLADKSFDEFPTDEQIKDLLEGLELVELAEEMGLTPEDLDEAVHEAASKHASEVNGSLEGQIDYLIDAFGSKGARPVIEDCRPRPV